ADGGVVETDAAVVGRRVWRCDLVEYFCIRFERYVTVGKADRNKNLVPLCGRDFESDPFAEIGRAPADVDGNVEDAATRHAQELSLGERRKLVVKAAQHVSGARQ